MLKVLAFPLCLLGIAASLNCVPNSDSGLYTAVWCNGVCNAAGFVPGSVADCVDNCNCNGVADPASCSVVPPFGDLGVTVERCQSLCAVGFCPPSMCSSGCMPDLDGPSSFSASATPSAAQSFSSSASPVPSMDLSSSPSASPASSTSPAPSADSSFSPSASPSPSFDTEIFNFGCGMGNGWYLVRRVKTGTTWHPATDNLMMTDSYGTFINDDQVDETFSRAYLTPYDQYLFATGDRQLWLIANVDSVRGVNYANLDRPILQSSISAEPYTAKWYNRISPAEDPWISLIDHASADSGGGLLYGEASFNLMTSTFATRNGVNVFVRQANGATPPDCPSSS